MGGHIHLDPVGGVAGDMFAAAMSDAWPEHRAPLLEALASLGAPPELGVEVLRHNDGLLVGNRFRVNEPPRAGHTHFAALRHRIAAAPLPSPVADRAIAIFSLLAEAEGAVHGIEPEKVSFHEVGEWDSVVDVVAAAFLIEAVGPATWSAAPLPLGSGRVRSAHGDLPVPAPAAERLLHGFVVHDDGRPGERITPTGAAIIRHLAPAQDGIRSPRRLARSGIGFGTRRLEGTSNVLRVLAFEDSAAPAADSVAVIAFEVDDQTPEDLAVGMERLRATEGVLDLWQVPVYGKKGRMAAALRLLAVPARLEAVINACFAETTTIGLRWHFAERAVLARRAAEVDGTPGRAKVVMRGDRRSAKAEMDDIAGVGTHMDREAARRAVEDAALWDEPDEF